MMLGVHAYVHVEGGLHNFDHADHDGPGVVLHLAHYLIDPTNSNSGHFELVLPEAMAERFNEDREAADAVWEKTTSNP